MALPAIVAGAAKAGAAPKLAPLLIAFVLMLLMLPVLVIVPVVGFFIKSQEATCQTGGSVGVADPPSLDALAIATKIYDVGEGMHVGERYELAAYVAVLWESGGGVTMSNPTGGDRTSTGTFQQQNFSPWTDHGRNRDNVSDAATSFFEQARISDRPGYSIGDLAVNTQHPDETLEYRYRAPETLVRAKQFLVQVKASVDAPVGQDDKPDQADPDDMATYVLTADQGAADDAACGADQAPGAAGPADIAKAVRLTSPREMTYLPRWATASGYSSAAIHGGRAMADARVIPSILWLLRTYNLRVHDCLASGHNTHGAGESCDIVPADDPLPVPGRMTAGWSDVTRMAHDLGWVQPGRGYAGGYACNSGMPFAPAIYIICYNGDSDHGDPAHITGPCACPHIHITFQSPVHGAPTALPTPPEWVMVFPVQADPDGAGEQDDKQPAKALVDVVGDSLAVGAKDALATELADDYRVQTDARDGRRLAEGMRVADGLSPKPDVLAVSLFTNDDPQDVADLSDAVRQSTQDVAAGGCVVWATIARPGVGGHSYEAANRALRSIAADNPQVVVVDWAQYVAAHPAVLGPDGVHPTVAGYAQRAALYAEGVQSCA